ncbi:MAG: transporter substrate-binding domain-containing protein [Desulfobulbaceae bacterium]|nr:transporter substrate-binding domain-containing protein [Desulfobulbaceae bacterium]
MHKFSMYHLFLFLVTLGLLSGCTYLPIGSAINPENLPATIRVGLATDAPPLSYRGANGMRGLDPQLAAGLKGYSKLEVQYVPLPRKELLDALMKNEVDVVMAGLTAKEAKQHGFASTRGYLQSGLVPLILLDQQKKFVGTDKFKAEDVRLGTVLASPGPAYVRSLRVRGTHQIFSSPQAGVDTLLRKRIDVLIHDMPTIFHYASLHIEQGLIPGTNPLTREEVVWALLPEDRDLRLLLNAYLQEKQEDSSLAALITSSLPFYNETPMYQEKNSIR